MTFRLVLLTAALAISAGAQTSHATDATTVKVRQALAVELPKRFAHADANHDGRLTREEARDTMPRVHMYFDEIGTAGRGYVTEQDIRDAVEQKVLPRLGQHFDPE